MSGMLGAIAIASVRASRQAEGGGAVAAGGPAFVSGPATGSALTDGASGGRGLGKGTFAAARAGSQQQANSRAATVTMAARAPPPLREDHLRYRFGALEFGLICAKEPRKAPA